MNFVDVLKSRELLHDTSDENAVRQLSADSAFYIGFDPSAASLQIGNLVAILAAIHIAKAGLKPIILFGGATGSIGDPSGKKTERPLLDRAAIDSNVEKHSAKVSEIFDRLGIKAQFVNNYSWTAPVGIIDFLREVGKYFTLSYMLGKEFVKTRVEEDSISYTEFSYMLLQAFDFMHLYQNYNCKLQIGGSDQWGNITAGLELIRRKLGGSAMALSFPLITDSQGRKFGKSEGGAVWLDRSHTSPYKFHQFWLNVEDASVIRLLKNFTFLELDQIAALQADLKVAPEKRAAQNALADAVCDIVHGPEATREAKRSAAVLFGGSIEGLSDQELLDIFGEVPSTLMSCEQLDKLALIDLLVETKLQSSKGEARRLLTSGGVYVNNTRINEATTLASSLLRPNSKVLVLRTGKKNYYLVKIS